LAHPVKNAVKNTRGWYTAYTRVRLYTPNIPLEPIKNLGGLGKIWGPVPPWPQPKTATAYKMSALRPQCFMCLSPTQKPPSDSFVDMGERRRIAYVELNASLSDRRTEASYQSISAAAAAVVSCRLFTGCRHRSPALLTSQSGFTDTLQGFADPRNFCPHFHIPQSTMQRMKHLKLKAQTGRLVYLNDIC